MNKPMETILARYGRGVDLVYGDESKRYSYKAFLQPLRYKNKIYLEGVLSEIGYVDEGHYLYLGPPQYSLNDLPGGSKIVFGGHNLYVKRAETVFLGDEKLYVWAVLQTQYEKGIEWSV